MMSNNITLEQVEQQVTQLPLHEQLKLMAHISERLSVLTLLETAEERQRREHVAQVESFLKMCDEMAAESVGEVDSAEEIRQIREERMARL
ncbi:MAG: hypothetical protein A2Z04_03405 [Chloroflexi bacterium RBG_16_57_9]|nr:MAG: hypothetical protein A2Z04_03405 [Chloroflexi bacterium RBG_16_57_9]